MARCRLQLVWLSLSSIVLSATALLAPPVDSVASVTPPPPITCCGRCSAWG